MSGFPFYHLFYTASHGILVNILIIFLTEWKGGVDGLQGCQECLDGLWAAGEGLALELWLVPDITVEPKGRAGCTSRGRQ